MRVKKEGVFFGKGPGSTHDPGWRHVCVEIRDGRCFVKLCVSLPINGCVHLSNPLEIDRDAIFLEM